MPVLFEIKLVIFVNLVRSMPESDETQQDIKKMKWHIENLDNKVDMLIRGNAEALEDIAKLFQGDSTMAQVYLAVNGERTQNEIVEEIDSSPATVSRRIKKLDRYGLIMKKEYDDGVIYMKDEIHDVLRLENYVDPETGWNDD